MSATACNFKNPRIQVICSVSALCTQRGVIQTAQLSHSSVQYYTAFMILKTKRGSGTSSQFKLWSKYRHVVCSKHSRLSMRNLPQSSTAFKMFFGIKVKPVIDQDIHTCTTQITTSSKFTFKTSTNHQKDTKLLISSTDQSFTMADISQRTLLCSINITQSN